MSNSQIPTLLLAACLGALLSHWFSPAQVRAETSPLLRYMAVTGPYQQGVSLLYVIDQHTQRLAVYEARGGASNSHRLVHVGSRNIRLDTALDAFNDESEYSFKELEKLLKKRGVDAQEPLGPSPTD